MREPQAKPAPAADAGPNKTGNQPGTKRGLRDVKDIRNIRSPSAPNRIDLKSNELLDSDSGVGRIADPTSEKGATLACQ
jgi:hypothetical protein